MATPVTACAKATADAGNIGCPTRHTNHSVDMMAAAVHIDMLPTLATAAHTRDDADGGMCDEASAHVAQHALHDEMDGANERSDRSTDANARSHINPNPSAPSPLTTQLVRLCRSYRCTTVQIVPIPRLLGALIIHHLTVIVMEGHGVEHLVCLTRQSVRTINRSTSRLHQPCSHLHPNQSTQCALDDWNVMHAYLLVMMDVMVMMAWAAQRGVLYGPIHSQPNPITYHPTPRLHYTRRVRRGKAEH